MAATKYRLSFSDFYTPVGKTFRGSNDTTYQIVGVCDDWRADQFRDVIRSMFYGAAAQQPHAGWFDFETKIAGEQLSQWPRWELGPGFRWSLASARCWIIFLRPDLPPSTGALRFRGG